MWRLFLTLAPALPSLLGHGWINGKTGHLEADLLTIDAVPKACMEIVSYAIAKIVRRLGVVVVLAACVRCFASYLCSKSMCHTPNNIDNGSDSD